MKKRFLFVILTVIALMMILPMQAFAGNIDNVQSVTVSAASWAVPGGSMPVYYQYNTDVPYGSRITKTNGDPINMMYVAANAGNPYGGAAAGGTISASAINTDSTGKLMWVYCLEHNVSHSVFTPKDVVSINSTASRIWKSIPRQQQRGIEYTLIGGFPATNCGGHAACDAYAATQAVIWEFQTGKRTLTSSGTSLSGQSEAEYFSAGAKEAYNWLVSYVGNLNKSLNFSGDDSYSNNILTLKWNNSKNRYEGSITDTNGVLSLYNINTPAGIAKEVSGNKVTFYATTSFTGDKTVRFQHSVLTSPTRPSQSALILTSTADQEMIVGTAADPAGQTIILRAAPAGKCRIVKTSEDGQVAGVQFRVTGPNGFDQTVTTKSNGQIEVSGLVPGTYNITEITNDKYVEPASQTVTITENATASVHFKNALKKFSVTCEKQDSETVTAQGEASLQGAVYGLFKGDEKIAEYTTDKNGKFTTASFPCGSDYYIQEITPSKGYQLDETKYYLDADPENFTAENNVLDPIILKEDIITGNAHVTKVDAENPDDKLSGAEFEVYEAVGEGGEDMYETVDEKVIIIPGFNVYPSAYEQPFIFTHHEDAWIDDEDVTVVREVPFLIPMFDTIGENIYVDKNAIFGLGIDVLEYDFSGFFTPYDDDYYDQIPTVVSVYATEGYKYLFEDGYNYLIVALADGTVYKERLITIDASSDEMHQRLVSEYGVKDGTIMSQTLYDRYVYMVEFLDELNEQVASGEINMDELSDEERIDIMMRMQYGGIHKGVMFMVEPNDSHTINPYFMFQIYDPDRSGDTEKIEMSAILAKTLDTAAAFTAVGVEDGTGSINLIFGGLLDILPWQQTYDSTLYDNLIKNNNIVWDQEFVDENDILGFGAGKTYPMAYLTIKFGDKEIELIALDISSEDDTWENGSKPYILDKNVFDTQDGSNVKVSLIPVNFGTNFAFAQIQDETLAESASTLDSVKVTVYQVQKVTRLIQEKAAEYYNPGEKIGTLTETSAGEYGIEGLKYGKYFIRETKAPEGYLVDDTYYIFEISENGTTVTISNSMKFEKGIPEKHIDGEKLIGLFADEPIYATVTITKTDVVTGETIPNAGFRIKDKDGNVVIEGYTDENGEFSAYLRYGKYTYEEFDAPEGYKINPVPGTFEILEDGSVVKASMSDERIPEEPTPHTGDTTEILKYIVMNGLAFMAIGFVIPKRKIMF